jgi:hypothetical protein
MPLIRCTSCGYANATDAKACKRCATELLVPPHLMRCPYCGSLNPIKGTACVWCFRKLPGRWRKFRRLPTRVVVGSMAVAVIAVLAYYAYPRGLPQETPRSLTKTPTPQAQETPRPLTPAPPEQETPPPEAKRPAIEAPRAERQPAETPREKAPRPPNCTEAVAALGLCESRITPGRE